MIDSVDEVLKANLVLVGLRLIRTDDQKAAFDAKIKVDTLVSSPAPGASFNVQSPSGPLDLIPKTLTLGRDRIAIDLMPDRTTISVEYPTGEHDLNRLAEIARIAIDTSDVGNQQLRAFGFNIESVYKLTDGELAGDFISNHIFAPGILHNSGFQTIGGSSKLMLLRDDQLWNIGIEPRFGDFESNKVFMTLNLHYVCTSGGPRPSRSTIVKSLKTVWDQAEAIVEGI